MKRYRKPLLIAGVGLYLVLGIYLIATSHDAPPETGRTRQLVLAVPAGVKTAPVYREAVREFEAAHPDISVRLLETSGNFYQKVTVMIAGRIAPDLMWMGQSFNEFAERDIFLDLSDRVEREIDLGDYPSEILDLYRKNGRLYGLPFGIDASFIAYNRKLLREAGLPDPPDDWNYDLFLEYARKLTRRDEQGRIRTFGFNTTLPVEIFNARLFDPETGLAACDSPEMLRFFRDNLAMMNDERVIPTAADNSEIGSDTLSLFRQEKVAMMLSFTMRWDRAFEILKDADWGVTLSPNVERQAQWASSQAICIYRGTREPEAAWELCKFFQRKEFQMAMSCRSLPARRSFAREFIDNAQNMPHNFRVMHQVLEVLAPTPRMPNLQELMAVFNRYRGEIFAGRNNPEEGMARCAAEINRRIELNRARKERR